MMWIQRIALGLLFLLFFLVLIGIGIYFGHWFTDSTPPELDVTIDQNQTLMVNAEDGNRISFLEVFRNQHRHHISHPDAFRIQRQILLTGKLTKRETITIIASDGSRRKNQRVLFFRWEDDAWTPRRYTVADDSSSGGGTVAPPPVTLRLSSPQIRAGDLLFYQVASKSPLKSPVLVRTRGVYQITSKRHDRHHGQGCLALRMDLTGERDITFIVNGLVIKRSVTIVPPNVADFSHAPSHPRLYPKTNKYYFQLPVRHGRQLHTYTEKAIYPVDLPPAVPFSQPLLLPNGLKGRNTGITFVRKAEKTVTCGSPLSGRVCFIAKEPEGWYTVKIDHGNGIESRFLYLKAITQTIDSRVKTGEKIGIMGKNGLHWSVYAGGIPINPEAIMSMDFQLFLGK